ncbi:MAG: TetR family transcriptional regulator [Nocardia sp.]|uniref:TetR/AcrR family transcriptional regulator n=1 Tax=Nocardia sp. TaxID=1821 RepID=UPI0026351995|nr:TetR/AcrR family transcriptional regulator [Nocardia sp.]MCU1641923.1 TetR family transcriptional regulator [Nocardia sp.]
MPRRSQEDRSRATRAALEEAGRRLFAERGFAGTSAEDLVSAAGVTRGALHHHYGDKRGLFLVVLEQIENETTDEIESSIATVDPDNILGGMAVGLSVFLEICRRPAMLQIVLTDAPTVLGWSAWREFETAHSLGLITAQLERAREAGLIAEVPIPVLAQLLISALSEAALIVAHAEDPEVARGEAQEALMVLIGGIVRG